MKSILYIHNESIDSKKANIIQVLNMCSAFTNEGVNVKLLVPKPKRSINNISLFLIENFGIKLNFKLVFYKKKYSFLKIEKYFISKEIIRINKDDKYQYLFTRLPLYIKVGLNLSKKIIFESHNNLLHNRYKIIDIYWKRVILKNVKNKNFKLFISISENLKNYWITKGITKKKCISLHDSFNPKFFINKENDIYYRKKLNLPLNKKIITYTGSLYHDRNIDLILKLAKNYSKYFFCVVGGPEKSKLYYLNQINEYNISNVLFTGRVNHSDVHKYLFSSDVLLAIWSKSVKTINYCSPLKIFEYMASGINILTQNHKTIMEVLNHKSAYIYNYHSFEDMKMKLMESINDCNKKIGKNAKKIAFNKHTWSIRIKNIIKFLDE